MRQFTFRGLNPVVVDGDTLRVVVFSRARRWQVAIRLQGVWAPERGEPGGFACTWQLQQLLSGVRAVDLVCYGWSYDRLVCQVYVAPLTPARIFSQNINDFMCRFIDENASDWVLADQRARSHDMAVAAALVDAVALGR